MKLASIIDPGISSDFNAAKPWCFSPLLSSMNVLAVSRADTPLPSTSATTTTNTPASDNDYSTPVSCVASSYLSSKNESILSETKLFNGEWKWHGTTVLEEDNEMLLPLSPRSSSSSSTNKEFKADKPEERRKYFQKLKNRQENVFRPGFIYNMEVSASWGLLVDFFFSSLSSSSSRYSLHSLT